MDISNKNICFACAFSALYGGNFIRMLNSLGEKLEKAGLITSNSCAIFNKPEMTQHINSNNINYIDTLINALETKTKIEILYRSPFSHEDRSHILWPAGMYFRSGNLYLYAYDPKYNAATSYAFSRIKGLSLMYDEHYTLPEEISMTEALNDPFGVVLRKPQKVKVHISPKQAYYEKEKQWPEGTIILENDDGSIYMELTISDPYALRSWALSLGKECKVISPDDLSEWIRYEHEEALKLYSQIEPSFSKMKGKI